MAQKIKLSCTPDDAGANSSGKEHQRYDTPSQIDIIYALHNIQIKRQSC